MILFFNTFNILFAEGEEEEDEEFEDDLRMDTEEDGNEEGASSSSPQLPAEDRSCLDEDSGDDQMDFEDSNSRVFLDDEDSSSRAFNNEDRVSSPSIALPSNKPGGRKNKRKNFQPRNIMYYADSDEDQEKPEEEDKSSLSPNRENENSETPLDLSETPVRRSLLPRRLEDLTGEHPSAGDIPRFMAGFDAISTPHDSRLFAEQAMRRLLGLCGLQENLAGAPFLSGKF